MFKTYDVFSETRIFVLTNNLRCFDETDVRTSQKTTYAQFKIYRTNFIDEIGPWFDTVNNTVTRWMNFRENHLHEHDLQLFDYNI